MRVTQLGGPPRRYNDGDRQLRSSRRNVECYKYREKGHFAHDCRLPKKKTNKGNLATTTNSQGESEEDWDSKVSSFFELQVESAEDVNDLNFFFIFFIFIVLHKG